MRRGRAWKSERRFHYERACRASTFEITNLSVQKTQCVNGPYGCFFLPEHLQVSGGGQTESDAESPALSSLRPFLFECVPSLAFPHFVFSLNKFVHSDAQFYRTNGC